MFAHSNCIRGTQDGVLKINTPPQIHKGMHTSTHAHIHTLSPSVHCNCKLSYREIRAKAKIENKPLEKKKKGKKKNSKKTKQKQKKTRKAQKLKTLRFIQRRGARRRGSEKINSHTIQFWGPLDGRNGHLSWAVPSCSTGSCSPEGEFP